METNKLLSMIGLCKKAGSLKQGNDAVKEAILKGEIHLVLVAENISKGTLKGISDVARYSNTPLEIIPVTIDQLGERTGKKAGILGIANQGFADAIKKIIVAS